MLSPELRATLDTAIADTKRRRHEFITLEHLLLALLDDPSAKEVLLGCGANLSALRTELEEFLEENVPRLEVEGDVLQTVSGGRVSMLYKPSETFSLRFSAYLQDIKSDGTNEVDSDPETGESLSTRFARCDQQEE